MTPEQLKNSILQYAIQGKLVKQIKEEGTAEELYKKIKKEKEKLIKEGKLLKKTKTSPFYSEEELKEINIPKSWIWVQLSDVSIIQEGPGIRKWQYRDEGIQVLCVTNILEDNIDKDKKKIYISNEEYKEKYTHLTLNKGDIVTSCSGGSWGKISFYNIENKMILNTSTLRMRFYSDLANNKYLYYVCKSQFFKKQLILQMYGMQPNFGYSHYSRIMIPLPPLDEQKRIVKKIEELLPLVESYSNYYNELEKLNENFPLDMKKSILQYAIQGKLVKQIKEEGTAEELYRKIKKEKEKLIKEGKIKKEKLLLEIKEEEIPFEIPNSWKWVRFGEIFKIINGFTPLKTNKEFWENGKISWFTVNDIRKQGELIYYTDKKITDKAIGKNSIRILPPDTVLLCCTASIGECAITKIPLTTNQQFNGLVKKEFFSKYIDSLYVFYYIKTIKKLLIQESGKTTFNFLSVEKLSKLLIPLPPLEEQKRIVAKIEELLPLINNY